MAREGYAWSCPRAIRGFVRQRRLHGTCSFDGEGCLGFKASSGEKGCFGFESLDGEGCLGFGALLDGEGCLGFELLDEKDKVEVEEIWMERARSKLLDWCGAGLAREIERERYNATLIFIYIRV
uniref:Uncharacterized protein n=1 Tax=Cannabis sativa TaxID=3483 RepID=A0A803PST0_CANSA